MAISSYSRLLDLWVVWPTMAISRLSFLWQITSDWEKLAKLSEL